MGSTSRTDEEDGREDPVIPAGIIDGIDDVLAGRTADDDDLDAALDL